MNKCETCKLVVYGYMCDGCIHDPDARDKYEPMTNADEIRSTSDEELAEFLWEQNGSNRYWKLVDKYVDWLQQPAKEEHHEAD